MSMFDVFRRKRESLPQQNNPLTTERVDAPIDSIRIEVSRLYDKGINPLHAVRALLHDREGNPLTDAKKCAAVWLGINDLLDRDNIEPSLRNQLVEVRDILAKTIEDSGPEAQAFVTNYRESTRRINEMKFLQSYKLIDDTGTAQREALENMLVEIEYERTNNPGSLAQDISEDKLEGLYKLRDNWDDPRKLD